MIPEQFADLHQHVLWGLDDGPRTLDEMQAQLKMAHENGIALIAATSHAYPEIQPFDMAKYQTRLVEANALCRESGWPLRLTQGCEIRYCNRVPDLLRDGMLPTLAGTRHVLVEFSEEVRTSVLTTAVNRLFQAGYWPVIAHVERCRCLAHSPRNAVAIHEELGVMFQMNCDTLLDPRGFFERRFVRHMLEEHAIDLIATDAHNITTRTVKLREAYTHLYQLDENLADTIYDNSWKVLGQMEP